MCSLQHTVAAHLRLLLDMSMLHCWRDTSEARWYSSSLPPSGVLVEVAVRARDEACAIQHALSHVSEDVFV